MANIGVIGAGKWGEALHYSILKTTSNALITSRTVKNIKNFTSLENVLSCEYIIIAIPVQVIQEWLEKNFKYTNQKILVAAKGIEASSGLFLQEIYAKFVPIENLGFLSGPSFASEVVKGLPTAIVINSISKKFYTDFASFFPENMKTYYSDDILGAEIAGAYKNVIAIASGICEGLKLGNNAKASLISRGLVEMERFAENFGEVRSDTFYGLSGAGDLFLTANSELSRNFRVGLGLAKGKTINTILNDLGEVAEGVKTSEAIFKIANEKNIYTPIANEVYKILHGKNPKDSLKDLLSD